MALVKCKECGKEFSDTKDYCIHCGCPLNKEIKTNKKVSNVLIWLLALLPLLSVLLLWVIWYLFNSYVIGMLVIIILLVIFNILLVKFDYNSLQKNGINTKSMGDLNLFKIVVPKYIYKRANMLGHNLSYFIIWIITFIFFTLVIILEFNPLKLINLPIKQVQEGTFYSCPTLTVNEFVDYYIKEPNWTSKRTSDGEKIVTVNGKIFNYYNYDDINVTYVIKGDEFDFKSMKIANKDYTLDEYNSFIDYLCYKKNSTEDSEMTDYEEDLKNSKQEISDNFVEISMYQFMNKASSITESSIVYIGRDDCTHCGSYVKKLNKVLDKYDFRINYLDMNKLNEDDMETLSSFIDEEYGIPLTLLVGESMIYDKIQGDVSEEAIEDFFRRNYFIQ